MLLGLSLVGAVAGCDDSFPSTIYFSEYENPALANPRTRADGFHLEFIRQWGAVDGPFAFSRIRSVAAKGRWLVVVDEHTCSLKAIELDGSGIRTIGRCGEGPGEFTDLDAVAFEVDGTVLASDRGTGKLYRIYLDTEYVVSVPFRDQMPDSFLFISSIAPVGPSESILGMRIQPAVRGFLSHSLVARLDHREARITETMVDDAPIAKKTRRPFLRGALVCASGDDWAVTNLWSPQTVVVDGKTGRPLANFGTMLDWRLPEDREEGRGEWRPPSPLPGLGCTEDLIALSYLQRSRDGDETVVTQGYLEVRSKSGEILFSQLDQFPGEDSPTAMTVGAVTGDTVFFFSNSAGLVPEVRAYRLVPR